MNRLLILALFLLSNSCTNNKTSRNILKEKFQSALKDVYSIKKGNKIIKFDNIATFQWDSLYCFDEEVSSMGISRTIGTSWTGPDVPSHTRRIVFANNRKVVAFIDCPEVGPFNPLSEEAAIPVHFWSCKSTKTHYSRANACFAVSRHCNGSDMEFEFVPLDCINTPLRTLANSDCNTPLAISQQP